MSEQTTLRMATEQDVTTIHEMIMELAVFEKLGHEVQLTEAQLRADGFGDKPKFEVILAELQNEVVGMAFFYPRYSTWVGPTLHLEDLVVKQNQRGKGIGKALLERFFEIGKERGVKRLAWEVLDWNDGAIRLYERQGAEIMKGWLCCRKEF